MAVRLKTGARPDSFSKQQAVSAVRSAIQRNTKAGRFDRASANKKLRNTSLKENVALKATGHRKKAG